MRVGCGGKRNIFLERQPDDFVRRVELVYRFSPASSGKLNRQAACVYKIQGIVQNPSNIATRPMPMNFDQIDVGETINQTSGRDFANASEVILIDLINTASDELLRTLRHRVEHLRRIVEVMDRAKNEIEVVPIFLHPLETGR